MAQLFEIQTRQELSKSRYEPRQIEAVAVHQIAADAYTPKLTKGSSSISALDTTHTRDRAAMLTAHDVLSDQGDHSRESLLCGAVMGYDPRQPADGDSPAPKNPIAAPTRGNLPIDDDQSESPLCQY